MANNDAVLAELEAQLRAPDSILEPEVLDLLKDYLRAGGKPQAAIEDLSENYCGYAQMCNVMCEWLEIADVRVSSNKHGSSGGALGAAGFSGAAALAGAAGGSADTVPDEFMLLSVRHLRTFHKLAGCVLLHIQSAVAVQYAVIQLHFPVWLHQLEAR
ncbi:TH1 protein-domain-containing protein [Scenedesmus sp. NREL 46B-D3]|nr:TH1 protein-domain-containing protein [Scenedesmus sp. NREL 46B-D3]